METRLEKLNTAERLNLNRLAENSPALAMGKDTREGPTSGKVLLFPEENDLEQEILALEKSEDNTKRKAEIVKQVSGILENPRKKETIKELNRLFKQLKFYQMADYLNVGSEILAIGN